MAAVTKTITLVSGTVSTVTLTGAFKKRKLRILTVSGTAVDLWVTVGKTTPADPVADADDAIFIPSEATVDGSWELDIPEADNSEAIVKVLGVGTPKLQVIVY